MIRRKSGQNCKTKKMLTSSLSNYVILDNDHKDYKKQQEETTKVTNKIKGKRDGNLRKSDANCPYKKVKWEQAQFENSPTKKEDSTAETTMTTESILNPNAKPFKPKWQNPHTKSTSSQSQAFEVPQYTDASDVPATIPVPLYDTMEPSAADISQPEKLCYVSVPAYVAATPTYEPLMSSGQQLTNISHVPVTQYCASNMPCGMQYLSHINATLPKQQMPVLQYPSYYPDQSLLINNYIYPDAYQQIGLTDEMLPLSSDIIAYNYDLQEPYNFNSYVDQCIAYPYF